MSHAIVRIENLSKRYQLGASGTHYGTFREALTRAFTAPFLRRPTTARPGPSGTSPPAPQDPPARPAAAESQTLWALQDLSLDIDQGQVLGVIGRNGAGKSTLLKILSRITEPTRGRVTVRGRMASLLEVGTGFHSELTGRENIYLSGAILGMSRREITARFDEIASFAGIERFLDTPIKRYSSGMEMRLAFSVAAHLQPEILVIDEVLAVGDAAFQAKCIGKMQDVTKGGRTVILVSHNMGMIRTLCDRCILLSAGRLMMDDEPTAVVSRYVASGLANEGASGEVYWPTDERAPGFSGFKLCSVRLLGPTGAVQNAFEVDQPVEVEITYRALEPLRGHRINLQLLTAEGIVAFTTSDHSQRRSEELPGCYRANCIIPPRLLNRGRYVLMVYADIPGAKVLLPIREVISLIATGARNHGSDYPDRVWPGAVAPRCTWTISAAREPAPCLASSGSQRPDPRAAQDQEGRL